MCYVTGDMDDKKYDKSEVPGKSLRIYAKVADKCFESMQKVLGKS